MDDKLRLTNTEWEVCECLWERSPLTITQIARRLTERTGWTKSTGETLVRRMEEKGLLRWEQGPRAKLYYPKFRREEAARTETRSFLDRVYGGRLGLMMNAMVDSRSLTPEEAALRETRGFLRKVFGGSVGLMVSAMAESEDLSQEEIDELYAALKKLEEKRHG